MTISTQDPSLTTLIDMAATTTPVYVGQANTVQPAFQFTVTSVSKAGAAVFTVTAHGLNTDNLITIAGATGDWAGLNGNRIVTRLTADTFSVAVDSGGFAGSFNASAVVTTTAPRMSAACWRIYKNYYDATPNLVRTSFGGGGAFGQIYDSRATLSYN